MGIRTLTAAAIGLLMSSTALAQEIAGVELQRRADIFGGVGFGNFAQDLGDVTNTGIGWGIRVGVQPLHYAGAELAYQGINAGVDTIVQGAGVLTDRSLRQQQITANAKVGVPVMVSDRELRPYGLIGLGYSRISADNALTAVGFEDDNQFAVPLGVGVTYSVTDVIQVDGRFTYNFLSGEDQAIVNDQADSWTALVNVGAQFGE